MNNILITGANGNIGYFLYNNLSQKFTVIGTRFSKSNNQKKLIQLDLSDSSAVDLFVQETELCNTLIFLVGLAHKKGKKEEVDSFRAINVQTLKNILTKLKQHNKLPEKFIFASTISVYGERLQKNSYTENSNTSPFSPYAVTKLEAEEFLLNNYTDQSWILRLAPVYAPNFLLNIQRRTKMGGMNYKVGKGIAKLSLCNMGNIESAVEGILSNKVPAGVYNISDEIDYTYNDLLKHVNANWIIPIPSLFMKGVYGIGKIMNNVFLKENAIKLISDNIFPSDKIRKHITLPATLDNYNSKSIINNYLVMTKPFSLLTLICLSPIFALVALATIMDDGFPIFFRQRRIGINNNQFWIYKFRTMKKETPDIPTHLVKEAQDYNTIIGPILRKLSIDELPQLINILKGEMVFIGPRPALYNQDDLIKLRTEKGIHKLVPGVTGWAQINGRDNLSISEKVELDEHYLKNKSFWLNIKILFMTFTKALFLKDVSH